MVSQGGHGNIRDLEVVKQSEYCICHQLRITGSKWRHTRLPSHFTHSPQRGSINILLSIFTPILYLASGNVSGLKVALDTMWAVYCHRQGKGHGNLTID